MSYQIVVAFLLFLTANAAVLKDADYFKELELKANSLSEPKKELVSYYVEYLKTGKPEAADNYIQTLKKSASKKTTPTFSIFEGDLELCHFEKNVCTRGLGELTTSYLVPKLKNNDKKALELLYAHTTFIKCDGADSENLKTLIKKLSLKKNRAFFEQLRKEDSIYKDYFNAWF